MSFGNFAGRVIGKGILSVILLLAAQVSSAESKTVALQKSQVAGFYRLMLGNYEVTSLYDGYVSITNDHLKGLDAHSIDQLFEKMYIDSSNGVQTAVNAFLINTNEHLILVDTGAETCFGSHLGRIQTNLVAAGYRAEQVDVVLLTHLHPDHACGITSNNQMNFPNATLYVAKAEADYWLSEDLTNKAPIAAQSRFKMAQAAVRPYQAAGKFKVFTDKLPLTDVQIVASEGHTPGHSSYLFSSAGKQLLVWGDIIHSHSIQFKHPEVALDFDIDTQQAVLTRKKMLASAAENKLWIAGAHLPFPGLGHVIKDSSEYRWVPVEFGPVGNQ